MIANHCSENDGQIHAGLIESIRNRGAIHIHLFGKAGSGKYNLLNKILSVLKKEDKINVACYHGVPSFQMRGYTIDEMFQIESTVTRVLTSHVHDSDQDTSHT